MKRNAQMDKTELSPLQLNLMYFMFTSATTIHTQVYELTCLYNQIHFGATDKNLKTTLICYTTTFLVYVHNQRLVAVKWCFLLGANNYLFIPRPCWTGSLAKQSISSSKLISITLSKINSYLVHHQKNIIVLI